MRRETQRIDPYEASSGTGVVGRMADSLSNNGHNVGSFAVDRFAVALVGEPGVSTTPMIVNKDGVPEAYLDGIEEKMRLLHNVTGDGSGLFGETWSGVLIESLDTNELMSNELDGVTTNQVFPTSYLSTQLETVSRLIATREERCVDRDTFFVQMFGTNPFEI